jgi:hypothetical protein
MGEASNDSGDGFRVEVNRSAVGAEGTKKNNNLFRGCFVKDSSDSS